MVPLRLCRLFFPSKFFGDILSPKSRLVEMVLRYILLPGEVLDDINDNAPDGIGILLPDRGLTGDSTSVFFFGFKALDDLFLIVFFRAFGLPGTSLLLSMSILFFWFLSILFRFFGLVLGLVLLRLRLGLLVFL